MIGKQISHFTITEKLGEGGMGVVYKADDSKLGRAVALKFLPPDAVQTAEDRERLIGEARAAAALDHPNICTVYEIGESEGQTYIAMAHVEGESLRERIDRLGPLDVKEAVRLARQIGEGLAAAHEKGIVHRDIKSANIMVTEKGRALIMDFGLAHHGEGPAGPMSSSDGSTVGTIAYGAPEQARGDDVDHRADVWSYGVTIFEMLTGRIPFKGDYDSAILYSVLNEPPESLREARPDAPVELERIVNKALSKDAADRFQSVDEMVREIRGVLKGRATEDTGWLGYLTDKRVLVAGGLYVLGTFVAAKIVETIVGRMMLSPHIVGTITVGLLSLVPTVILLSVYAARRAGTIRSVAIGVPVNVIATAVLLFMMFSDKDLGAATTKVEVTDEQGQTIERVIPKASFRARMAMYLFENKSGDESLDWLQYAAPLLLEHDCEQDVFVACRSAFSNASFQRLRDAGVSSWLGAPVSLKRKIAAEFNLNHFVTGKIESDPQGFALKVDVYEATSGKRVGTHRVAGNDVFTMVDEITLPLLKDMGVPEWHLDQTANAAAADIVTDSPEALRDYALALKASEFDNDREEATRLLEAAVATDSTFASAYYRLFRQYSATGDGDKTMEALATSLRHEYKLPERWAYVVKANYYFYRHEPDKAFAVVRMATELYPEDPQAFAILAQVHFLRGEIEDAIAAFQRVLELDPDMDNALLELGELCTQIGRYDEALSYYERYAKANPKNPRSYEPLGRLYTQMAEHDKAKGSYERALLIEPERVGMLVSLARVEVILGNYEGALEQFTEALRLCKTDEDRIAVYEGTQEYYAERGELNTAVEHMEKRFEVVAKIAGPLQASLIQMGELDLFVRAGMEEQANTKLAQTRAQLANTQFSKAVNGGELSIALEKRDVERSAAALAGFEEYVESFKIDVVKPQLLAASGRIDALRGDHTVAIDKYKQALELSPATIDIHYQLGISYRDMGDAAAAEQHFLDRAKYRPFDPRNNLELALLLQDRGDMVKAREYLAKAVGTWQNADSGYEPAQKALRTLSEWDKTGL